MARLEKLCENRTDASGRTNVVIVAGHSGDTLADQTCPHFPKWLDRLVASRDNGTVVVWVFHHDLRVENLRSWFAYCEAGEELLQELINMQRDDSSLEDDALILIGHKLGSFVLKKALVEASRTSHKPNIDALLNTIETLVMLGDPNLVPENQTEWISLILKCLPQKTLPKHLSIPQDAKCLEHVASRFEEFTVQSTLLQLSGSVESKKKHILKLKRHTEGHRCLCSAKLSVRMWTTAAEEVAVSTEEGNMKLCAFHAGSSVFERLALMIDIRSRLSITSNSPTLQVQDARDIGGQGSCSSVDETVVELTDCLALSTQAADFASQPTSSTNLAQMTTMGSPFGMNENFDTTGESEDTTLAPRHASQQLSSTSENSVFPITTASEVFVGSREEGDPEYREAIQEAVVSTEGQQEDQIEECRVQGVAKDQVPSEDPLVHESSRVVGRAPFFSIRIPKRDSDFFGREELLTLLEKILAPSSMPSSDGLSDLDSNGLVMLHGIGGVGKSSIALELTYRIQELYDHIFWLRANNEVHLARSYHEAAISLRLVQDRGNYDHESSREILLDWLLTTRSKWLLVFDDADMLQVLPRFLPNPRRGSIIITTRHPCRTGSSIETDASLRTIEVRPFNLDEANAFLHFLAPHAIYETKFEAELAGSIINSSFLPYDLRRIGMRFGRRSMERYRSIMAMLERHSGAELLSQPQTPLAYAALSSRSKALADVLIFLDPYQIEDAILLGAQRCTMFPSKDFPMTDDDYFDAKEELSSHALLRAGADSLEIHRVTHRSLRERLDPISFRRGFQCASQLLEVRWPSRRKMKNVMLGNWPEFDSLHSHVHELSTIYMDIMFFMVKNKTSDEQNLMNDSYLRILLLSTWYNAYRGNAKEDRVLIRLVHVLIATGNERKLISTLHEAGSLAPRLLIRLVDVGLSPGQLLRVVDIVSQIPPYVALSYSWSKSRTMLTKANLRSFQEGIKPCEVQEWQAAIDLARKLGIRYLWIDSLCVIQDDPEERLAAISNMPRTYSSCVCTLIEAGPDITRLPLDQSIDCQPFSMFLNWSQPEHASSVEQCLHTPSWRWDSRSWTHQEHALSRFEFSRMRSCNRLYAILLTVFEWMEISKTSNEDVKKTDLVYVDKTTQTQAEVDGTEYDNASVKIDEGIQYVDRGKHFEALASFTAAKELVSVFKAVDLKSQKIYATASADIAIVYLRQNLPEVALGIVEASLAFHSGPPLTKNRLALELCRLHFVMGNIHNALGNPDESMASYKNALQDLQAAPEEKSKVADWKSVLNLKFAEHLQRAKDYKGAHALLRQSLEHFQSQDTVSAQAHLARTLHRQAITYEAEGSKVMGKAIQAAAKETWIAVREARGRPVAELIVSALTEDDFDAEVEFCYR